MPILTGWSTAGGALLITCLSGVSMPEAIGAFMFAALLTALFGVTGFLEKIIKHIPSSLTSAMLAGILIHFGMNVFVAMEHQFALVGSMILTYLMGKRLAPRYTMLLVLAVGIGVAKTQGLFHNEIIPLTLASPVFTWPTFSASSLISVGIPLFVVTMTSQNIPGIAILNSSGYKPPISFVIGWTGFINFIMAPMGCYSICLAALTATICASKEADHDPENRYRSTVFAGICWLFIGLFGATVVSLFSVFPKELIAAIAGLALIGTIGQSINTSLVHNTEREPALMTLLVSASGVSFFGIGAAFWGLTAGIVAAIILHDQQKEWIIKASKIFIRDNKAVIDV